MDLVRLGLERGRTAAAALEVDHHRCIEEFGQGGVGDTSQGRRQGLLLVVPGRRPDRGVGARDERPVVGGPPGATRATAAWRCPTGSRCRPTGPGRRPTWPRRATSTGGAAAIEPDRARRQAAGGHGPGRRAAARRRLRGRPGPAPARWPRCCATTAVDAWGRRATTADEVGALPPAVIDRLGTGVSLCMHLTGVQATTSSMIAWLPRRSGPSRSGLGGAGQPVRHRVRADLRRRRRRSRAGRRRPTWHRFEALRDRVEQAGSATTTRAGRPAGRGPRRAGPDRSRAVGRGRRPRRGDPTHAGRWARGLWSRVEPGLVALGV